MKGDRGVISSPAPADDARKGTYKRRPSFTRGDVAALVSGALLVLTLVSWLCLLVGQNLMRDRAVGTGRPASALPSH
jgi:hypothetical protein